MDKIAEVKQVDTGLQPSAGLGVQRLWEDGRNIRFARGTVTPQEGQAVAFARAGNLPVIGMMEAIVSDKRTLYYGDRTSLFRYVETQSASDVTRTAGGPYDGVEHESVSTVTGVLTNATRWSFAHWGTTPVATNGVDRPQVFDPTEGEGKFKDMWTGDAGTQGDGDDTNEQFDTAEIVITFTPYMLAMNTSGGGTNSYSDDQRIHWSDNNIIDTVDGATGWVPAATNDAGSVLVRDIDSPILAALPLGPAVAFYGANSMHAVSFIGAPFYFSHQRLLTGIGVFGKGAVTRVGRMHYGFGPRGIWRTDGVEVNYIDEPDIHRFVFENINPNQTSKIWVWHDSSTSTVWFWVPTTTDDIDIGLGFCYQNQTWTIVDYARTSGTSGATFENPLMGDKRGNIFSQSVEGTVFSPTDRPLVLNAIYEHTVLYGDGQYGEWVYGGYKTGDG